MTTPTGNDESWENPVRFNEVVLPAFPTACLPEVMKQMVESTAECMQVDESLPAAIALGIASAAVQKCKVRFTYDSNIGLYVVVVAKSGEGKTPCMKYLLKPLRELQEAKHREDDETDISSGFSKRHYTQDFSPEVLTILMNKNNGAMAVIDSESGVFSSITRSYTKGGDSAALSLLLSAWSGETYNIDRVGRGFTSVANSSLAITTTIQPPVLNSIMHNEMMEERGLLARFLFCYPASHIGYRDHMPYSVPISVQQPYDNMITMMATYKGIIQASESAIVACDKLFSKYERMQLNELENMSNLAAKLSSQVIRVSAILYAAECASKRKDPTEGKITEEYVYAAAQIVDNLIFHAKKCYGEGQKDPVIAKAQYVWQRIRNFETLSKSETLKKVQGKVKTVKELEPALKILEERGYIRMKTELTGGRAKINITTNPLERC